MDEGRGPRDVFNVDAREDELVLDVGRLGALDAWEHGHCSCAFFSQEISDLDNAAVLSKIDVDRKVIVDQSHLVLEFLGHALHHVLNVRTKSSHNRLLDGCRQPQGDGNLLCLAVHSHVQWHVLERSVQLTMLALDKHLASLNGNLNCTTRYTHLQTSKRQLLRRDINDNTLCATTGMVATVVLQVVNLFQNVITLEKSCTRCCAWTIVSTDLLPELGLSPECRCASSWPTDTRTKKFWISSSLYCLFTLSMSLKRAQLVAFTNAFQGESGLAPYEEEPWLQYSVDDLLDKEKLLSPLGTATSLHTPPHTSIGTNTHRRLFASMDRRCIHQLPTANYFSCRTCTPRVLKCTPPQSHTYYSLDCDLFDLFRPVRDPRLVATELSETRTTLSSSGLMDDLACPICMGAMHSTHIT